MGGWGGLDAGVDLGVRGPVKRIQLSGDRLYLRGLEDRFTLGFGSFRPVIGRWSNLA